MAGEKAKPPVLPTGTVGQSSQLLDKTIDTAIKTLQKDFSVDLKNLGENASRKEKWMFLVENVNMITKSEVEPSHAGVYVFLNCTLAATCGVVQRRDEIDVKFIEDGLKQLCEYLGSSDRKDAFFAWKAKMLVSMFHGFNEYIRFKYFPYMGLLKLSAWRPTGRIPIDVWKVRNFIRGWNLSREEERAMWKQVHRTSLSARQSMNGSRAVIEFLRTYDDKKFDDETKFEVEKALKELINDPNTYLYDTLVLNVPIFLTIPDDHVQKRIVKAFVFSSVAEFDALYEKEKKAFEELHVQYDVAIRKVRIINLLRIAERRKNIAFETLERELNVPQDEIQQLLVETLRTRMLCGKVDEKNSRLKVMSAEIPYFDESQWKMLQSSLRKTQAQMQQLSGLLELISQNEVD